MGIDPKDFDKMQARLAKVTDKRTPGAVERERDLHEAIIEYCKKMGYLYRHDRMDKPTTGQIGWPDFEIFQPLAMTVFLECKAKGAKANIEQLSKIAQLRRFGYVAEIVDNIIDAIKVIES